MELLLAEQPCGVAAAMILWTLAAILVIAGIVMLVRRAVSYGIVLIIVALVGPGGAAIVC
jgi:hypothetical protein